MIEVFGGVSFDNALEVLSMLMSSQKAGTAKESIIGRWDDFHATSRSSW
jgi:hypothetical protein